MLKRPIGVVVPDEIVNAPDIFDFELAVNGVYCA
jgi:hypothetical protein